MPIFRSILFVDGDAFRIDDGLQYIHWRCDEVPNPPGLINQDDFYRLVYLFRDAKMFGEQDLDTLVRVPWSKQVMRFSEFIKTVLEPIPEDHDDEISISTIETFVLSDSDWEFDDREDITDEEEVYFATFVGTNPHIYEETMENED